MPSDVSSTEVRRTISQPRFGPDFVQKDPDGPIFVPPDRYTDPERFRREIESIFHTSWLRAFRAEDVSSPRDYKVWERFGQTVVITRHDDGRLRGFHNVCQHRGARIVRGEGDCGAGRFACPWHGFTYDLDGVVVSVPRRDSFHRHTTDGLRAPEVAVDEWGGWVWVHLTSVEAPRLVDYLGELHGELEWYGMQNWKVWGHRTWEIKANWKVVQEGFLEAWHVPYSHKDSLPGTRVDRDVTFHTLGRHNMMVMGGRDGDPGSRSEPSDHRAVATPHYLAWPNAMWNCNRNVVQAQIAWPVSVNTTLFEVWGLAPEHQPVEGRTEEEWIELMGRIWENTERVIGEDVFLAGEASATRASLGYTGNRLTTQEHRISSFHAELDRVDIGDLHGR